MNFINCVIELKLLAGNKMSYYKKTMFENKLFGKIEITNII
jgi:hypothetical protein